MLGRLVDYGSDDEDNVPVADSPIGASSPTKNITKNLDGLSKPISKKREAEDESILPPAKVAKLHDTEEDADKPDAATLAQRNAKSLTSILPKPKTATPSSGDVETNRSGQTGDIKNQKLPHAAITESSPRKIERATHSAATSLPDADPAAGVIQKKQAASLKTNTPSSTPNVVGPAKPSDDDGYGYGYAVLPEAPQQGWDPAAYSAYGYPSPYGYPVPGVPAGYTGSPATSAAPAPWAREMARSGASMIEINAKELYEKDRDAYVAQAEADGGVVGGVTAKMFSKTARSRHQLTAMAAMSKDQEKLLAAKKAAGLKSKAETRAKYGW